LSSFHVRDADREASAVSLSRDRDELCGCGRHPAAYITALVVTLSVAALASYLPARRAVTIDPIETLKAE
jgi:hypothetical protein